MTSLSRNEKKNEDGKVAAAFVRTDLLRWLYLARITLVSGILLAALLRWQQALHLQTFVATSMFVSAVIVTGASFWYTHILKRRPGRNFLYGQVIFDVLLVTGTVHITLEGAQSDFAWLFILVISEGALLLPLPGGVLIGALASILYFADIVWGSGVSPTGSVMLQIGLFAMVALATGLVGDRLRQAGMVLGSIQSELHRLRLDTRDILATISTGVATLDEEGTLIYMNPAGESLLEIDAKRWTGDHVLPEITRASPGLAEIFQASFDAQRTLFRQRAVASRNGEEIVLGVSTTLRDEPEELRAVTAIFQDITDFERLEGLNRRNE
jgi:PAS domain S-box-containing protein